MLFPNAALPNQIGGLSSRVITKRQQNKKDKHIWATTKAHILTNVQQTWIPFQTLLQNSLWDKRDFIRPNRKQHSRQKDKKKKEINNFGLSVILQKLPEVSWHQWNVKIFRYEHQIVRYILKIVNITILSRYPVRLLAWIHCRGNSFIWI